MQPGTGGGPPRARVQRWYSDGEQPVSSEKRELNEPRLEHPTRKHTSVTVRLAALRSASALDPPSRQVVTWRGSVGSAEGANEVIARVASPGGQRSDVDLRRVIAVDQVTGAAQTGEPAGVWPATHPTSVGRDAIGVAGLVG